MERMSANKRRPSKRRTEERSARSKSGHGDDFEFELESELPEDDENQTKTRIFVKNLTGSGDRTFNALQVELSDPVVNVKAAIQKRWGVRADQQGLTFAGMQLDDDRTLADYGVVNYSTIQLFLRQSRVKQQHARGPCSEKTKASNPSTGDQTRYTDKDVDDQKQTHLDNLKDPNSESLLVKKPDSTLDNFSDSDDDEMTAEKPKKTGSGDSTSSPVYKRRRLESELDVLEVEAEHKSEDGERTETDLGKDSNGERKAVNDPAHFDERKESKLQDPCKTYIKNVEARGLEEEKQLGCVVGSDFHAAMTQKRNARIRALEVLNDRMAAVEEDFYQQRVRARKLERNIAEMKTEFEKGLGKMTDELKTKEEDLYQERIRAQSLEQSIAEMKTHYEQKLGKMTDKLKTKEKLLESMRKEADMKAKSHSEQIKALEDQLITKSAESASQVESLKKSLASQQTRHVLAMELCGELEAIHKEEIASRDKQLDHALKGNDARDKEIENMAAKMRAEGERKDAVVKRQEELLESQQARHILAMEKLRRELEENHKEELASRDKQLDHALKGMEAKDKEIENMAAKMRAEGERKDAVVKRQEELLVNAKRKLDRMGLKLVEKDAVIRLYQEKALEKMGAAEAETEAAFATSDPQRKAKVGDLKLEKESEVDLQD